MKRVKSFCCASEEFIDDFINEWIDENPNYKIISINHGGFSNEEDGQIENVLIFYETETV